MESDQINFDWYKFSLYQTHFPQTLSIWVNKPLILYILLHFIQNYCLMLLIEGQKNIFFES